MKRTINICPTWHGIAQIILRAGNFGHQAPFMREMLFKMASHASGSNVDIQMEQEEVSQCLVDAFKETGKGLAFSYVEAEQYELPLEESK